MKIKPLIVVMETLNIKNMMKNKYLSKAIQDQCLYELNKEMEYKYEFCGIEFIEADKWFSSSKMYYCCGIIKKDLKLSDRVYKYSYGLNIDRDLNASINPLKDNANMYHLLYENLSPWIVIKTKVAMAKWNMLNRELNKVYKVLVTERAGFRIDNWL